MIRLKGYEPYKDIDIEITGLRPGEKLYEELLVDHRHECNEKTAHQKIFIEKQREITLDELKLDKILGKVDTFDNESIKEFVASVITTYNRNNK